MTFGMIKEYVKYVYVCLKYVYNKNKLIKTLIFFIVGLKILFIITIILKIVSSCSYFFNMYNYGSILLRIQSMYLSTLVYIPGQFSPPQGVLPKDTIPTISQFEAI